MAEHQPNVSHPHTDIQVDNEKIIKDSAIRQNLGPALDDVKFAASQDAQGKTEKDIQHDVNDADRDVVIENDGKVHDMSK